MNEPRVVGRLVSRVAVASLRDAPLRAILQACYDLHGEGAVPTFERVALRLEDPAVRALAAGLLCRSTRRPSARGRATRPLARTRLAGVLASSPSASGRTGSGTCKAAPEARPIETADPDAYRALQLEYLRLMNQRPDTKTKDAS